MARRRPFGRPRRAAAAAAVRALRRFARATAGAAAVEFALVGSALLLLVFGLFEVGRAIHAATVLEVLADEAARASILSADCVPAEGTVSDMGSFGFGLSGAAFTLVPASAANGYELRAGYDYAPILPILGDLALALETRRALAAFCDGS
ncbi:MAG: pilus assembly protein [Roseicyclus sp.]|jgi:Flp pilus assembly pilin Flp|nr:pilus assembly protein [Roseicyclus sp.]